MAQVEGENGNSESLDASQSNWQQRLWRRFVDWLVKPVPFFGQWPSSNEPQQPYSESDEESAAKP